MSDDEPSEVVEAVLEGLGGELLRVAARIGVRETIAAVRRADRATAFGNGNGRAPKSAKWAEAGRVAEERPDIFGVRIPLGNDGQKLLGDCDARDLVRAEEYARHKGEALVARAGQYAALRGKLRGGRRVGQLARSTVEGIFNA